MRRNILGGLPSGLLGLVALGFEVSPLSEWWLSAAFWLAALLWLVGWFVLTRFHARSSAFAVRVRQKRWESFQQEWLMLLLEVEIENRRDVPKQITSWRWHWDNSRGGRPMSHAFDVEPARHLADLLRRRQALPSHVDPHEKVRGWVGNSFRKDPSWEGEPYFVLTLRDELNIAYRVARVSPKPSPLQRLRLRRRPAFAVIETYPPEVLIGPAKTSPPTPSTEGSPNE